MRYSLWLASTGLLTLPISAFHPFHPRHAHPEVAGGRTVPSQDSALHARNSKALTIDIKKRPSRWTKRDNRYDIDVASEPTAANSMGISQDGDDVSYFAGVQIGSKGKRMWMLIDSGAATTWVFGSDCTVQACREHNTFGRSDSDTLEITSVEWDVEYGVGEIGGIMANDKFSLAGHDVDVRFGLATNVSDEFANYPMDGILALGRDTSNRLRTPTIMEVMSRENLLEGNMYGVHLSRSADGKNDGQITFGAPDESKFLGDLSYTEAIGDDGLWELPVDGASVDGQSLGFQGKTAIIDTGTSFIKMPPDDAEAIHAKIPGSMNHGQNFSVPCDTQLPIQFTFSGITYEVPAKDYVASSEDGDNKCTSKILGDESFDSEDDVAHNAWMLGDVFLKNVYTVFDFDEHRIGFGIPSEAEEEDSTSDPSRIEGSSSTDQNSSTSQMTSAYATSTPDVTPSSIGAEANELGAVEEGSNGPANTDGAPSLASSLFAIYSLGFAALWFNLCL